MIRIVEVARLRHGNEHRACGRGRSAAARVRGGEHVTDAEMTQALEDVTVVELTDETGDTCGRLLADLGANVIKVEPPGGSSFRRSSASGFDHDGTSYDFIAYNLNKRSIILDLDAAADLGTFKRLLAQADCFVESMGAAYMDAHGLGDAVLRQINPRMVITSITPFGSTGPLAGNPATDLTLSAEGGAMATTGAAARAPLRMAYPQVRQWAGAHAAASTMMALNDTELTGRPHRVDVPMILAVPWFMISQPDPSRAGKPGANRRGIRRSMGAASLPQVVPCKDGWVNYSVNAGPIAAAPQRKLVEWMHGEGMAPQWLLDFDFAGWDGAKTTKEWGEQFEAALVAFFATKTRKELAEFALKNGLFLGPVRTIDEVINERPFGGDETMWWTIDDHGESAKLPGAWVDLSETPLSLDRGAPRVDEHRAAILDELARAGGASTVGTGVAR
ncbi:MAG: hypothetical protein EXR68_06100 [Dehalococcoidia bacterium]|nr:hypothetical protein [Dehalococcoidia bacterium]